jgi:hypothetical protein
MKSRLICVTAIAFALIGASFQMSAQEHAKHHHYKLIDLGTFGGPQSYINGFEYGGPLHNLNNAGTLAGWADTSALDPYGNSSNANGNFCFNYDGTPCYASHAFVGKMALSQTWGHFPADTVARRRGSARTGW